MAGEIRALTIARGARRRGPPRAALQTTDAHFAWRINAALNRLKGLLAIIQRGERTAQTVDALTHLEYQIEKLLTDAQLVLIDEALAEQEQKTCDG